MQGSSTLSKMFMKSANYPILIWKWLFLGFWNNRVYQELYHRVTSFDALKQSTGICAKLITVSSRKYIILNKCSCFQSKHTFWAVRECLFCISPSMCVSVPPFLKDTSFDAFHWLLHKTFLPCSPVFTGCTL